MGTDKAARPLGGVPALVRVVDALAGLGPVVVVAAPGQVLAPCAALVVRDAVLDGGPLPALALGLRTAAGLGADAAVVCAVDTPLVHPVLARALLDGLGAHDVLLPELDGRAQPLLAAWSTRVAHPAQALVDAGERRLQSVLTGLDVLRLDRDALLSDPLVRAADPGLGSFGSANTRQQWAELERRLADRRGLGRAGHRSGAGFLDSTRDPPC